METPIAESISLLREENFLTKKEIKKFKVDIIKAIVITYLGVTVLVVALVKLL